MTRHEGLQEGSVGDGEKPSILDLHFPEPEPGDERALFSARIHPVEGSPGQWVAELTSSEENDVNRRVRGDLNPPPAANS